MSNIIWQDPPASRSPKEQRRKWDAVLEELKSRPGVWALVMSDTSSGSLAQWKARGCETRCITSGKPRGKCDIYARWPQEATS